MRKFFFLIAALSIMSSPLLAGDDIQTLANDNSAFAFKLYGELSKKEGNLFFSPYSISSALAMTQAGARGETARSRSPARRRPPGL